MRDVTLLFLVKKNEGKISEICLAMKKRGFGMGKWNGTGGKLEPGETIEQAARREAFEELGIKVGSLYQVAELTFIFSDRPDWNQVVHTYFVYDWEGDPVESEEMAPQWYKVNELPLDKMWPDDRYWLPGAIEGKKYRAEFTFQDGDKIINQRVREVDSFAG